MEPDRTLAAVSGDVLLAFGVAARPASRSYGPNGGARKEKEPVSGPGTGLVTVPIVLPQPATRQRWQRERLTYRRRLPFRSQRRPLPSGLWCARSRSRAGFGKRQMHTVVPQLLGLEDQGCIVLQVLSKRRRRETVGYEAACSGRERVCVKDTALQTGKRTRPGVAASLGSEREPEPPAAARTAWGGAPSAAVLGHGVRGLDDVAQVGEASVAAGAGRRDPRWDHLPLRIGEIARVSFERRLAGEVSC